MQHLQSLLGIFALSPRLDHREHRVAWRGVGAAAPCHVRDRAHPAQGPASGPGAINDAVGAIAAASRAGTSFVFGYLGGGQLPYDLKVPGAEFVLALQALPIVLVMSVLTTLLFHWRILPPIVRGFSWLLERTLKVGGAVGLSTAANIFLGMVEAPLFIRPYLASLSRSELFMVMTGGWRASPGGPGDLRDRAGPLIPDAAAHFVIASVLARRRHSGQPIMVGAGHRHRRHRGAGRGRRRHHGRIVQHGRVSNSCSTSAPC